MKRSEVWLKCYCSFLQQNKAVVREGLEKELNDSLSKCADKADFAVKFFEDRFGFNHETS